MYLFIVYYINLNNKIVAITSMIELALLLQSLVLCMYYIILCISETTTPVIIYICNSTLLRKLYNRDRITKVSQIVVSR